ncbi:MAG TPA: TraR/DksA C4-type zinc finger protein [Cytophagaceae bacterium]|jgi:DnaK suppressor protein|nr:TraR/DksA C4-type zinc finger protein [Cytophagaceae bacterium]
MAKSNKKGKAVKAKKVESKSKTTLKSKAPSKIKNAVAKPKATSAKSSKNTKVVAKKASPSKKVVGKAKKESPKPTAKTTGNKANGKVVKKTPASKATSAKSKGIKPQTIIDRSSVTNLNDKKIVSTKIVKKNTGSFELGVVLRTGRRPEAIINKKNLETKNMGEEKLRYSDEELKEFEVLILEKLDNAKRELNYMKEMLSKKNDQGTDNTGGTMKLLEDGADTLEKENFSQLAVRQQKFVTQLENAVARIKNGTYGICIDTGKLIPKERLKAVPHTQHSIEAKLNRRN